MRFLNSIRSAAFGVALFFPGIVGSASWVFAEAGCTPMEQREAKDAAKDALTAAQILCIMASPFLDSAELSKACGVLEQQKPALDVLLSEKKAAASKAGCSKEAGGD